MNEGLLWITVGVLQMSYGDHLTTDHKYWRGFVMIILGACAVIAGLLAMRREMAR